MLLPLGDELPEAAGGGHDDLGLAAEEALLLLRGHAADDGHHADGGARGDLLEVVGNLQERESDRLIASTEWLLQLNRERGVWEIESGKWRGERAAEGRACIASSRVGVSTSARRPASFRSERPSARASASSHRRCIIGRPAGRGGGSRIQSVAADVLQKEQDLFRKAGELLVFLRTESERLPASRLRRADDVP